MKELSVWKSWTSCDSKLEANLELFQVQVFGNYLPRSLSPSWPWTCSRHVWISSSRYVCFFFFFTLLMFIHSTSRMTMASTTSLSITFTAPHCYEDDELETRMYVSLFFTVLMSTSASATTIADCHEDNDKGCRSRHICFSSSRYFFFLFTILLLT